MATEKFANNAQTTLVGDINDSVTSIIVASGSGFPAAEQFRIRIDNELLLVTAGGSGSTTWTVTRGVEGTTATSHCGGALVTHGLTAGAIQNLDASVITTGVIPPERLGSVTSVGLSVPGIFEVTGSPVTTTGTLGFEYDGAQGDILYASGADTLAALPKSEGDTRYLSNTGSDHNPAWAQVDLADGVSGILPVGSGGTNSSAALYGHQPMVSDGSGAIVEAGTMSDGQLLIGSSSAAPMVANLTAGSGITINNSAGGIEIVNSGSGSGTVSSVALDMPPGVFDVSGSPVTSAGTIEVTFDDQAANSVFAGPSSGSPTTPAFRALVADDIPNLDASVITSGVMPLAQGGTGQAAAGPAFDALSPLTTAGDLLAHDGSNNVRLPVGSNGQVLTADSTQPASVKWATPAGDPLTTKGDLMVHDASSSVRLAVGTDGLSLIADSTQAKGVKWGVPSGFFDPGIAGGRLTTESGQPVSTADRASQSTLYYTPYLQNRICLYDGSAWSEFTFTQPSLALSGLTAGKNYDVFLYDNAGTLTLELSSAWTNDTTRATALVRQDGVWVKSGATTRRYLGTIRAVGTTTVNDTAAFRGVWNVGNRVRRLLRKIYASGSYNYTTDSWRQVGADASNRVEVVVGLAEPLISLKAAHDAAPSTAGVDIWTGIGEDSTSAPTGLYERSEIQAANRHVTINASLEKTVPLGYHAYNFLERSQAAGTTAWNPGLVNAGLEGSLDG